MSKVASYLCLGPALSHDGGIAFQRLTRPNGTAGEFLDEELEFPKSQ